MRILIGYDGSDCAKAALTELPHAGFAGEIKARVLCVVEPVSLWIDLEPGINEPDAHAPALLAHAEQLAQEGAALLRKTLPDWTVETSHELDDPRLALVRAADEWPADLLLVGSHGRGFFRRLLLGSVAQYAVRHSGRSVRINRRGEDGGWERPPRLMLATDGSASADAALRQIARRTWPKGTNVWTVSVAQVPNGIVGTGESPYGMQIIVEAREQIRAQARRAAVRAAQDLCDAGLDAEAIVLEGDPKRRILQTAHERQTDCIFLGARGHGLIERLLIGSVTAAVSANALCSVEIVRPSSSP